MNIVTNTKPISTVEMSILFTCQQVSKQLNAGLHQETVTPYPMATTNFVETAKNI